MHSLKYSRTKDWSLSYCIKSSVYSHAPSIPDLGLYRLENGDSLEDAVAQRIEQVLHDAWAEN